MRDVELHQALLSDPFCLSNAPSAVQIQHCEYCCASGSGNAQPKERPEELLPALETFMQDNPGIKAAPKVSNPFPTPLPS